MHWAPAVLGHEEIIEVKLKLVNHQNFLDGVTLLVVARPRETARQIAMPPSEIRLKSRYLASRLGKSN